MNSAQPEAVYLNPSAIAAALGGKARGNQIAAPAPGHSRSDRSLSVLIDPHAPEGFLVNGHAGEDAILLREHVRRCAGMPERQPGLYRASPPTAHLKLVKPAEPPRPFSDHSLTSRGYHLAAAYEYVSPDGEIVFEALRYHHATKPKTFLQRRPDGNGGWLAGRGDAVLYRLPDLLANRADPVFVVEGEKDADGLASLGYLATTPPQGSWPADLSVLAGRRVFVLADNDEAGEKKAIAAVDVLQGIATVSRVDLPGVADKGDISDWLDAGHTTEELEALCQEVVPVAANDNLQAANQNKRFTIDWFGDIEDSMPKETFIKGVLGVNEFTMLSGKPGTGKSVIVTDMACHVAAGMEWHGRKVKQGLVVYIAAERKDLTKRRMLAFRKRHNLGHIPLVVLGGRIDLTSSTKDADEITAVIKQVEIECGMSCVWIIIDTLTRTFGPGDQNASKDMTKFIHACDTIREGVDGSHLNVIHHTGWSGDRGKGAIDLDGAVDASFLVKKEAGGYILECDGTNDGDEGVITRFRMEGVQVGVDEDGEPTMAPVVVPTEGPASGIMKKLRGNAATALAVLRKLVEDDEPLPMALWRSECRNAFDDGSGKSMDALNKQFDRAKTILVDEGAVEQVGGGFLPT